MPFPFLAALGTIPVGAEREIISQVEVRTTRNKTCSESSLVLSRLVTSLYMNDITTHIQTVTSLDIVNYVEHAYMFIMWIVQTEVLK